MLLKRRLYSLFGIALMVISMVGSPTLMAMHAMPVVPGAGDMGHHAHSQHGSEAGNSDHHTFCAADATVQGYNAGDDCCGHGCAACLTVLSNKPVHARPSSTPELHYLQSHIDHLTTPPVRPPRA